MSNTDVFGAAAQGTSAPGLDRAAIESLIARQYTGLRLLIMRRTGNAEDLLNEAACTTCEKWQAGLIARPEEIGGYIFQVAMNLLRNHWRSVVDRGTGQFSDVRPRTTTCAWARTRSGIWRDR